MSEQIPNEDPGPVDESRNGNDEAASTVEPDAFLKSAIGATWKQDLNLTRLLGIDTTRFFPSDRFSSLLPSSAALDGAMSALPKSYVTGLPSAVTSALPKSYIAGLPGAFANIVDLGMERPFLPPTGFAALESLIPKSPATLEIVTGALADMFDRQWRSLTDPLGSFITGWFGGLDLPDLRGVLEALDLRVIPDNLHELGIDEGDLESVSEVLHDGIPLFWVPRARIAARLIAAPTSAARRAVIGHELSAITEDCLEILDLVSNRNYLYEADRLREAADLLATHPAAAQALATTTLDSMMYRIARAKDVVFTLVTSTGGRAKSGHEEETRAKLQRDLGKRGSFALAPVRPIYQQFRPREEEIPRALNKHASFHRVHPFQYSRRNAAIALMLGSSVLLYMSRWFDDELRTAQRRAESSG